MRKKFITLLTAAALSAAMSVTAFAAGWQQNATGWWYGTNADNSQWYSNGWQWIDGNNDGTAECYFFDQNGYMAANTTTPDGYQVNENGAWVENGAVQTKAVSQTGGNGQVNGRQTHTSQEIVNHLTAQREDKLKNYMQETVYKIDASRPENNNGVSNIRLYDGKSYLNNGWALEIYADKGGRPSYCFIATDPEGYMYVNTTTPDGYYVNEWGQLEIDGQVVKHVQGCWFLQQADVLDVNGNVIQDKNHADPSQIANFNSVIIQESTNRYAPFGKLAYNHIWWSNDKTGKLMKSSGHTECWDDSNERFNYPYAY